MKLRHAAALALCGWYLMLPPFTGDLSHPGASTDPSRPLSKWLPAWRTSAFDSATACTHALSNLQEETVKDAKAARAARRDDSYQNFLKSLMRQAMDGLRK